MSITRLADYYTALYALIFNSIILLQLQRYKKYMCIMIVWVELGIPVDKNCLYGRSSFLRLIVPWLLRSGRFIVSLFEVKPGKA
jgi:hypothetical protein